MPPSSRLPEPSADERAHSERLSALIRAEIAGAGAIPFARFMERCLYAPGLGYYSAGRTKFGGAGDFVTAPELGPLFAQCIARAVAPALGPDATFFELGGGSGAFAEDLLRALAALDRLPQRYWLLEPSATLRERQRERLAANLPDDLFRRVEWISRPPESAWRGVLFANEVVDALPTTRFRIANGEVYEEYVHLDANGNLARTDRPADSLVSGAVRHLERDLGAPFAEGYRSEVLPQLPYWLQAIAGTLESGLALFLDYGYPRREFYSPERRDGTLVAHYRHHAHADPLLWPGLQDLTAFVDFTALAEAGNSARLGVVTYATQAQLLIAAGIEVVFEAAYAAAPDEAARYRVAQEVKRLTLPGEMGERFQAMLFARDVDRDILPWALMASDLRRRL